MGALEQVLSYIWRRVKVGVAWMVLGAGQLSVGREGGKTQLKEPRPELEIREKRKRKEPGRANEPGREEDWERE